MGRTSTKKQRSKATDRGRFKLAVFFKNHMSPSGKAYSYWSNQSQDAKGISVSRFKNLVLKKPDWVNMISWAGIYKDGVLLHEYKDDVGEWKQV